LRQAPKYVRRQGLRGEAVPLAPATRMRFATVPLMLAALMEASLAGCTNVHCSTEGKGGGPGGCGLDLKFTTTDNLAPPGSFEDPQRQTLQPP